MRRSHRASGCFALTVRGLRRAIIPAERNHRVDSRRMVDRETDGKGTTSMRSLHPPFMNRLCPAETRLKEGADAHDSDQTGGNLPLPRVGGALSARSRQYQGTAASMAKGRKAGPV